MGCEDAENFPHEKCRYGAFLVSLRKIFRSKERDRTFDGLTVSAYKADADIYDISSIKKLYETKLADRGLSNRKAARMLDIDEKTIKSFLTRGS